MMFSPHLWQVSNEVFNTRNAKFDWKWDGLSWSLINPIMHSNYGMFPHSRQMLNLNFVHFTFLSGFELTDMKFTFLIYKTSQMVSQVQRKKMRYFRIFSKKKYWCFQINPTRLQWCKSTMVPVEKAPSSHKLKQAMPWPQCNFTITCQIY